MRTIAGIQIDLKLTFLIVISTLLPMLDYYNGPITGNKAMGSFVLYFIVPLAILILLFRESPQSYGLRWGNWRVGLLWTLAGCAGMALVLQFVARLPAMQSYYEARAPENVARLIVLTGVDLFGWEFMWRGVMLFGLARVLGPGPAIFLQAVPFAYMHLGKPEIEALSTIFGGAAFGFVAWKSQSFYYPFLIHWFISSLTQLIALGRL